MARPKLEIDENLVEKLAKVGCSNVSIAIQCECSVDTLTNRFSELLAKSRENLKTALRTWQLEAARKGNVTMQIWLGKQMLGQSDKLETKNENVNTDKLTIYLGGNDGKQNASVKNSKPVSEEESEGLSGDV